MESNNGQRVIRRQAFCKKDKNSVHNQQELSICKNALYFSI